MTRVAERERTSRRVKLTYSWKEMSPDPSTSTSSNIASHVALSAPGSFSAFIAR